LLFDYGIIMYAKIIIHGSCTISHASTNVPFISVFFLSENQ